jgi:hypothetical protein
MEKFFRQFRFSSILLEFPVLFGVFFLMGCFGSAWWVGDFVLAAWLVGNLSYKKNWEIRKKSRKTGKSH